MRLNRQILRLALPSILANVSVSLVGMADMAVVGHLDGTDGIPVATLLGGIAIGTTIFDLIYWCFGFLRAGTGGLTAQACGRGDSHASAQALCRALYIAIGAGAALILLQWLILQGAFLFIKCSPEVRYLSERYFMIRIWAAPATLSLFAIKGWFIGMQDSGHPMETDLIVNGVNITGSILLCFGLPGIAGMGFDGVALGTVIAQWCGLSFALAMVVRHHRGTFAGYNFKEVFKGSLRPYFEMNRDLFIRSLGLIAVYIGFTVISARYGDTMLAVSSIMMKLLMIFSYFTDGFAYAGEALTGRFIGEKSYEGLRCTIRTLFKWCFGLSLLFIAVYWALGTPLLRMMTSDEAVVEAGWEFLPWLLAMPLIGCPAFLWDGIYLGATASRDLRNATVLCAVGFFTAWFIGIGIAGGAASEQTAIHILMLAYFVHLAVRTVYLSLRYKRCIEAHKTCESLKGRSADARQN